MDQKEYTKGVMRTVNVLDTPLLNQLHMTLGMVTEAGELADAFKKHIAYNADIDWVNVEEELGDLMFYISAFCFMNNLDFEKILERNLAKLRVRYPDKFSEKRAKKRNLKKEREVLGHIHATVQSASGKKLPKDEETRILRELGYKV